MAAQGSSSRPTPSGTRDVLPDEMRELRGLTRSMIDAMDAAGYGEVRTPSVEYDRVMEGSELGPEPAYRVADEHGESLVLRPDMTLPIARIAATRFADDPGPLRFCYLAPAWRRVKPLSGEQREILQVGGELIGGEPVAGSVEVVSMLAALLEVSGLSEWSIGVGHAGIAPEILNGLGIPDDARAAALAALGSSDLAGLKAGLSAILGNEEGESAAARLARRTATSGDEDPFDGPRSPALDELARVVEALPGNVRSRVIIDFGLRPRLGYHEGLLFEVYDPAIGRPLGSGGSYDGLLARLGRVTTAVGFSLDVEQVHAALAGEELGEGRS